MRYLGVLGICKTRNYNFTRNYIDVHDYRVGIKQVKTDTT